MKNIDHSESNRIISEMLTNEEIRSEIADYARDVEISLCRIRSALGKLDSVKTNNTIWED